MKDHRTNSDGQEIVVIESEPKTPSIVPIAAIAGIAGLIYFLFFRGSGVGLKPAGTGKTGTDSESSKVQETQGPLTFLLSSKTQSGSDGPSHSAKMLLQFVDGVPVAPPLSPDEVVFALHERKQTQVNLQVTGGAKQGDIDFTRLFFVNSGFEVTTIEPHDTK